jgi:hypothetical protein
MELQIHYENFQALQSDDDRVSYLKTHKDTLETFDLNVDNLIEAWSTGMWTWNSKRGTNET